MRASGRPATSCIAFFADEEAGGVLGSHFLVKNHPELFAGATEAISEVGGYSIVHRRHAGPTSLQTGEKALIWVKLVARGTAGHGSQMIADNAVTRLAEAVAVLGRQEWPCTSPRRRTELLGEVAAHPRRRPAAVAPDELALAHRHGIAASSAARCATTTNPTMLTAGYKHNVVPDTAEALVDIRCMPGQEDAVLAAGPARSIGDDVEIVTMHTRHRPRDAVLRARSSTTIAATLDVTTRGARCLPYLLSGGTDNKALSLLGIKGYGFAPLQPAEDLDFPAMFHGVDERVPLDALSLAVAS